MVVYNPHIGDDNAQIATLPSAVRPNVRASASSSAKKLSGVAPGESYKADPSYKADQTVDELRSEVSALRRELRMLRMAHAELERVAVRDTLTPLYNRRYFLTAINERLVRAKRYNSKAAVLFIDVNRMKYINDLFGHSAGDYALMHVAQLVQAQIRTTDVAARIGGDEFAVILEQVDENQAVAKAQQLAEVIGSTPCCFGEQLLPVSASIGLTMVHPHDTEESLIERADADMYARKRAWHQNRQKGRSTAAA